LDSCLQAWENITVLDARYYLDLIKLFGGNLELAFLCLEKLHPYYLNKLLVKLNEVELKDNNIQDKLVGIIKDLLLIYHCRKSNHDTLPN